jgi:hypothetical protein
VFVSGRHCEELVTKIAKQFCAEAMKLASVTPGWSEGPDPESRDSPMCNRTS